AGGWQSAADWRPNQAVCRQSRVGHRLQDRSAGPATLPELRADAVAGAVPSGQLSGQLKLDFIARNTSQQLKLSGNLQLDNFVLNNHDGSPIVALSQLKATLTDVEPLISR